MVNSFQDQESTPTVESAMSNIPPSLDVNTSFQDIKDDSTLQYNNPEQIQTTTSISNGGSSQIDTNQEVVKTSSQTNQVAEVESADKKFSQNKSSSPEPLAKDNIVDSHGYNEENLIEFDEKLENETRAEQQPDDFTQRHQINLVFEAVDPIIDVNFQPELGATDEAVATDSQVIAPSQDDLAPELAATDEVLATDSQSIAPSHDHFQPELDRNHQRQELPSNVGLAANNNNNQVDSALASEDSHSYPISGLS